MNGGSYLTQVDFFGEWINLQQKLLDFYQGSMNPEPKEEEKKNSNNIESNMKSVQELWQNWLDISNQFIKQSMKSVTEAYPQQQEIINKMFSGASLYQNLHKFWEDLRSIKAADSNPLEFLNKWKEEYPRLVADSIIPFWPEQVQNYYHECIEIYNLSQDTANKFVQPWLSEAQELQGLLQQSLAGDQEAYIEFNRLWKEKFASTFGKVLNIPQFSMNRAIMQKQMHSINALINFMNTIGEFTALMVKVNQETLQTIIKDYQEMLRRGANPKTYKEFYDYWWQTNEAAYLKLFGTSEFSRILSQLLEAGVNYKKETDSLLEKQLEFLPYPSKTDMESVYKTLDTLKREVRTLKKEMSALKEGKSKSDKSKDA
jgi:class III poly(R)-hydroxyalkanoic acid synthase PhaE subunit